MRGSCVTGIVLLVAALHVAVVSMRVWTAARGLPDVGDVERDVDLGRGVCVERAEAARRALSRVLSSAWPCSRWRIRSGRSQLGGFWWPLAQFGALQSLVAWGIWRFAP